METFMTTREIINHLTKCHIPSLLLKIDFTKVFDSLFWHFIIQILKAHGFPLLERCLVLPYAGSPPRRSLISPPFYHSHGCSTSSLLKPPTPHDLCINTINNLATICGWHRYHITGTCKKPESHLSCLTSLCYGIWFTYKPPQMRVPPYCSPKRLNSHSIHVIELPSTNTPIPLP